MTEKEARNCRACAEKYDELLRAERDKIEKMKQALRESNDILNGANIGKREVQNNLRLLDREKPWQG